MIFQKQNSLPRTISISYHALRSPLSPLLLAFPYSCHPSFSSARISPKTSRSKPVKPPNHLNPCKQSYYTLHISFTPSVTLDTESKKSPGPKPGLSSLTDKPFRKTNLDVNLLYARLYRYRHAPSHCNEWTCAQVPPGGVPPSTRKKRQDRTWTLSPITAIQGPVLNGLGDMLHRYILFPAQVGNRPCHLQDAVMRSSAQALLLHRSLQ